MPVFSFEGRAPRVHPDAWIAPTATLLGDVVVEAGASVWYGAVLRADHGPILVRREANVQDGTVIHGLAPTEIGPGATVAHACVLHSATIGAGALVGNGSVVQDGAVIGRRSLVGAGSLVTPGTVIPDEVVALGSPCRVRGPLDDGARMLLDANAPAYVELARRHRAGLEEQ